MPCPSFHSWVWIAWTNLHRSVNAESLFSVRMNHSVGDDALRFLRATEEGNAPSRTLVKRVLDLLGPRLDSLHAKQVLIGLLAVPRARCVAKPRTR